MDELKIKLNVSEMVKVTGEQAGKWKGREISSSATIEVPIDCKEAEIKKILKQAKELLERVAHEVISPDLDRRIDERLKPKPKETVEILE